jgi:hypothetical protein
MATVTALPTGLVEQMANTPLFEGASNETIAKLAGRGGIRRYRRNTYLFHQGDDSPEVFFLHSGRVEISSDSANGHRQLHTTLDVPQFFGELGCWGISRDRRPPSRSEDSSVGGVSGPVLLDFLIEEPTAARRCSGRSPGRCCRRRRSSKTCCTWT